jgi:hypothetical protein
LKEFQNVELNEIILDLIEEIETDKRIFVDYVLQTGTCAELLEFINKEIKSSERLTGMFVCLTSVCLFVCLLIILQTRTCTELLEFVIKK